MFYTHPRTAEELGASVVFPLESRRPAGSAAVVPAGTFRANWDAFTEGCLRFLNWDNVVVAGGSIMACLTTNAQSNRVRG
jgi:hypothetical protein